MHKLRDVVRLEGEMPEQGFICINDAAPLLNFKYTALGINFLKSKSKQYKNMYDMCIFTDDHCIIVYYVEE